MAQAVAERVNAEQLCALLKGASREQAHATACALEKLLAEKETSTQKIGLQGRLAVQYSCDTQHRLLLHAQFYRVNGTLYKFEGCGEGDRPGSGSSPLEDVWLPEQVLKDTAFFYVHPDHAVCPDQRGYLFFLDHCFRPLNAPISLAFDCAPAFGAGQWSV